MVTQAQRRLWESEEDEASDFRLDRRGAYNVSTQPCDSVQDALDQLDYLLKLQELGEVTKHRAFEAARELAGLALDQVPGFGPRFDFTASVRCLSLRGPLTVRFGWSTFTIPCLHECVRTSS